MRKINVNNIGITTIKSNKMNSYKECEVRLFSKVAGDRYTFTIAEMEDVIRYVENMNASKEPLHIENRDREYVHLTLNGNMNGVHFKIGANGEPTFSHVFSTRELRSFMKELKYAIKMQKLNF